MTGPDDRDHDQSAEAPPVEFDAESDSAVGKANRCWIDWTRVLAYGIIPGLTLLLTFAAGFSKWHESAARSVQIARTDSLAAARESAVAILSYQADSVEKSLVAARDRLTSPYKDDYVKLTTDVVIPGARHDHVSVTATVPAAASVSATPRHAVAILFVDQAAAIGANRPTTTQSSIQVTLENVRGRWLISGFDPI
jgi:Mce-associated membrane protein